MKAIKAAVIGMGILIVVGIGLIGYGVSQKFGAREAKRAALSPEIEGPTAKPVVEAIALGQPDGSRVVNAALFGRRVAVTVDGGGLPPRVLIVDLNSGAVLSTLSVGR